MRHRLPFAFLILAIASTSVTAQDARKALPAAASSKASAAKAAAPQSKVVHKLVIQVNDNDPKLQNLALNNAKNVVDYYKAQGQDVDVRIVTYGPGLHMLRADTSTVKQRIAEMSLETPNISFSACNNTRANMAKQEGKDIPIISEAKVVPSGVITIMELQKSGFAYVRP
jgi:intracellular sulfur oxidation DsrE/DsrF family protein